MNHLKCMNKSLEILFQVNHSVTVNYYSDYKYKNITIIIKFVVISYEKIVG